MFKKPFYGHFSVDHGCMDGETFFKHQEGLADKVDGELMGDNKDSSIYYFMSFWFLYFIRSQ